MNLYEKIIIIDPNLDDSAADETIGKIKDVITGRGGEILKTENWGRRKLAYELNKHQKGNYVLLLFKSPPSVIAELERLCKIFDPVVKFMVVKLTKKKQIEAVLSSLHDSASKEPTEQKTETAEGGVQQEGENAEPREEKESV